MKLYLMRHFKVDYQWKTMYTSSEFNSACNLYDKSQIISTSSKEIDLEITVIYVSELSRTNNTAALLGLNKTIIKTELLNEVPMKSFSKLKFKIPTIVWFIVGRIQWYFNCNSKVEGRTKTKQRIQEFLNILEQNKEDCLIIGHGFYFSQMKKELHKRNFLGSNTSYYKNGELHSFVKTFRK